MRHVLTAFKKYSNYEKQPIVFSLHECRFFGGEAIGGLVLTSACMLFLLQRWSCVRFGVLRVIRMCGLSR